MSKRRAQLRLIARWLLLPALWTSLWAEPDYSTPYVFTTLAGAASIGGSDGPLSAAHFYHPHGVAIDAAGNLFVADTRNHTIRKITATGQVSTFAGAPGESGSVDGTGGAARFRQPWGVAVDLSGNVYVADTFNSTIRKITTAGAVSTLAGQPEVTGSDDGAGPLARFAFPTGVAVDLSGNVYVADHINHTIRKISPVGVVSTLAGTARNSGTADGAGSDARFAFPGSVAVDPAGNIIVADTSNYTVRKITPAGVVSTLAGSARSIGGANGTGAEARFFQPEGVAVDPAGDVFVADTQNNAIRKITPAGVVTTLAGTDKSNRGSADGNGPDARFYNPTGLAVDAAGNVFVADENNHAIRKVTPAGVVTTLAGMAVADSLGSVDGTGSAARFHFPGNAAVDAAGNVFVADSQNDTIRKITSAGVVTTFAGTAGIYGNIDGTGSAARFTLPRGITVDSTGTLYVADTGNHTIRKVSPAGVVSTLAGMAGVYGNVDGSGSVARFYAPQAIAVDVAGNIFVNDNGNHTIRRITPDGFVSTLAETGGASESADGSGGTARFYALSGIAIDAGGNVYVADNINHIIRKISPGGSVSTVAGFAGQSGSTDGIGSAARFFRPSSVAVDPAGNLFVIDGDSCTVRRITPAGIVVTLAGLPGTIGNDDGLGRAARFFYPSGVTVDAAGNLYVTGFSTVRKGQLAGPPVITTQPQSLAVTSGGNVQLSVVATGVPAPTYQWFYNGNPYSGATGSTLSFTSARTADAGDYTVAVTNALGTVTSGRATLTVTAAPAPPADSSGGGGGGALNEWFVLALLSLGAVRWLTVRQTA